MDRFKQYLQEHAEALDTDRPRDKVWQHIQQQAATRPKTVIRPLYWQLAAACLAGIIGLSIWWYQPGTGDSTLAIHPTQTDTPSKASPVPGHTNTPEAAPGTPEKHSVVTHTTTETSARQATRKEKAVTTDNPAQSLVQQDTDKREEYELSPLHHLEAGFIHIINLQLNKIRITPIYSENADYFSVFKKQFYQLNEDEKAWKRKTSNNNVTEEQLDELITIYEQKLNVLKLLQAEIIKTNKHYRQTRAAATSASSFMDI